MKKILRIVLERMRKNMKNNKRREDIIKKCACPCLSCKGIIPEMNPILIDKLLELENYLQEKVNINSGQRCITYNASVGGIANSPHRFGEAADMSIEGFPLLELAKICVEIGFSRVGMYPNHIHVDMIKPNPSKFWYVRKYNEAPIYSGNEYDLEKFIKKVRG